MTSPNSARSHIDSQLRFPALLHVKGFALRPMLRPEHRSAGAETPLQGHPAGRQVKPSFTKLYRLRRNRISRTMCSPLSVRSVLMVIEAESLSSCSTTYPGEARLSTSAQLPRRQDLTSSKTFPCAAIPSSAVLNP